MSALIIHKINNNAYQMNSYLVCSSHEAMIIDLADMSLDFERYDDLLGRHSLKRIVYTHGHFDHISGSDSAREHYKDVPHIIHELDANCFTDAKFNLSEQFGEPKTFVAADQIFKDQDTFKIGYHTFKVIHTPGHTLGGVCFYTEGHLFCGDTIFSNGVGRTDFIGGDYSVLEHSILNKIFTLPNDTLIYPGHGIHATTLPMRKHIGL